MTSRVHWRFREREDGKIAVTRKPDRGRESKSSWSAAESALSADQLAAVKHDIEKTGGSDVSFVSAKRGTSEATRGALSRLVREAASEQFTCDTAMEALDAALDAVQQCESQAALGGREAEGDVVAAREHVEMALDRMRRARASASL